ncbi:DNA-binding response regulator [Actinoplanes sp. OR16]|uniref:response regulator n=1 Tax=Actinoplanes sp. OR16 TaxID=946334 RepID=UPI000F6DB979|nr:response regulator transcription factor [Actinoplanes sp. OR16]BBH63883.1 DNA-binding response regulator [Actinoplanes sp. OR16]
MIRVALADDHELVRMGLRALIDREDDMEVVGEASGGLEAIQLLKREGPDILLLDVRMPGIDGIETLRRIQADPAIAGIPVIVVTTFEVDRYVFLALQAGAAGFILKDAVPQELTRAIRVVSAGEAMLSPSVTRRVISLFAQQTAVDPALDPSLDELTEREREMVAWVATGFSNEQIGAALFVSPETVRTHVSRAMLKLGARSRAQLVVIAVRVGLTVPR